MLERRQQRKHVETVKIQSAWRGYRTRQSMKSSVTKTYVDIVREIEGYVAEVKWRKDDHVFCIPRPVVRNVSLDEDDNEKEEKEQEQKKRNVEVEEKRTDQPPPPSPLIQHQPSPSPPQEIFRSVDTTSIEDDDVIVDHEESHSFEEELIDDQHNEDLSKSFVDTQEFIDTTSTLNQPIEEEEEHLQPDGVDNETQRIVLGLELAALQKALKKRKQQLKMEVLEQDI